MALPLFACTLFVSAFFLFLVQPIVGKMILPKLGGTPQVWNTCMVFFQTALLAGYAYTHTVSTRLKLRQQLMLHGIMLAVPFAVLLPLIFPGPFYIQGWTPNLGANPIPDTLLWLATRVGLPFLVIATSAPLLQKWFASTGHPAAKDPYFLYGASNLGSLLALLLYPVAVEPWLLLSQQAWLFTIGFGLLVVLVGACAAMVWEPSGREVAHVHAHPETQPAPAASNPGSTAVTGTPPANPATGVKKGAPRPIGKPGAKLPEPASIHKHNDDMTTWRRLRWIGLAAVPTSFMLGVTTHITTDLSPIPLFWLIPLTLYLLSFILVYSRWPVVWVEEPHKFCLIAQPIALALMVFVEILGLSSSQIWVAVFFNVLAFFLTALVCHGELAKDRPSTKHLTEYYLLMSVGGMVGGMFNGLLAPILFIRVIEFNIAVFLACLLRPQMIEEGWTDQFLLNTLEPKAQARGARGGEGPTTYSGLLDFVLPLAVAVLLVLLVFPLSGVVAGIAGGIAGNNPEARQGMAYLISYGLPLIVACFYFGRPVRFALAVGAVILVHSIYMGRADSSIYSDRSYFGIIRVKQSDQMIAGAAYKYNQLIHGHINHGMNFLLPTKAEDIGKPDRDFSRVATTYYHRLGPAGIVMEKFNWFPAKSKEDFNTYWADARMPASLTAAVADSLGISSGLPTGALVTLWSEPPFATIGLGTGTMASYARPYQHCHYYEIDNHIKRLSLPDSGTDPYFNYLQQAHKRGAEVQVLMGDARLRMALPYENHVFNPTRGGGPDNFYHMMVVDAFSSDAIPVHLITREALELYFTKLTEEGILCVHTSNRFVDLPKVVAAVAADLKLSCQRGHDSAPDSKNEVGHFTSEWVMVARKPEYLEKLTPPKDYQHPEPYWTIPTPSSRYLWTDDHSNLINVLR